MNKNSFGLWEIIRCTAGTKLNMFFGADRTAVRAPDGYRKIRDLTPQYTKTRNRVGLYQNRKGETAVVKHVIYRFRDLNYLYLRNEAAILSTLQNSGFTPELKAIVQKSHSLTVVSSYAKGKRLDTMPATVRAESVSQLYARLAGAGKSIVRQGAAPVSTRNPFLIACTFPLHQLVSVVKNPRLFAHTLTLSLLFYYNMVAGHLRGYEKGLVHRDWYPDNILFNKKGDSLTLLDWESAVISDPIADLAQIAMIYCSDFKKDSLIRFLREHLADNSQRRRFIAFAIHNALFILSREKTGTKTYNHTFHFLTEVLPQIRQSLLYKKSSFEIVNTATLSLIYYFYKITGRRIADPKKKILLCYHSIGNDGWRFSTRVALFEQHMKVLRQHYSFAPISDLLEKGNGGININFDDGYTNVLTNAFPVLKEMDIPATVFAIGDTQNADREELENGLSFMDINSLKFLKKMGWEIGFHTNTHGPIAVLDDKNLDKQFVTGKKQFEKKFGQTVNYLAYPKGYYDKRVLRHVARGGYAAAFTVDGKELITQGNKYLYDRVPVDGEISSQQLLALISPLGLRVSAFYLRLLQLKESLRRRPVH